MSIEIDKEFADLIPPLADDEFKQLEDNIVAEGIRDALVTWEQEDGNEILIDGHNRFRISAKHAGIPFQVKRMTFPDRNAAKAWIIRNQFGRRNLSTYDRSVLALKLKPLIAEKAKERMMSGKADPNQKSDGGMTSKALGKIAGVSHDTIHKVATIEREGSESTKKSVKDGTISINQAYLETRPKKPTQPEIVAKAEERHEDFQKAKQSSEPISFSDAVQNRQDEQTIGRDTYWKFRDVISSIKKLSVTKKSEDIDLMQKSMKGVSEKSDMVIQLNESIAYLTTIRNQLSGRR